MDLVFTPSDFVAVLNQTLDYAYPLVAIEGELANVRVSRGKWIYFDIKDELASVKCFGTVYVLPGPIEDGMTVRITAQPRLHPLYNFSLNLQSVLPVGEGSLKKAADLLLAKLEKEGLFEESRKQPVPFAPNHIGLITSKESAAYADFIKILNERWAGVRVSHLDVQVQGEQAITNIIDAIQTMNQLGDAPEVLVITRGGGSAEDLAVFNTEAVVRAIAGSRIPTLVAIGHEVDVSLAELAADLRASTPSNAAQLLVPDKKEVLQSLKYQQHVLHELLTSGLKEAQSALRAQTKQLRDIVKNAVLMAEHTLARQADLLAALNPEAALKRGYAVIRDKDGIIKSVKQLKHGQDISLQLADGKADATVK